MRDYICYSLTDKQNTMKEHVLTTRYEVVRMDELTADEQQLVEQARRACTTAYAPYSHFQVGAAVRMADGSIVCGSNQENAAFPSGMCAERTALFAAMAQHPGMAARALAIAAFEYGAFTESPVTPCGACRQVMSGVEERSGQDLTVLLCGRHEIYRIRSARALLPLQFGADSMNG